MKSVIKHAFWLFLIAFLFSMCASREDVSLGSLLDEMTNRDARAEYPSPYFTCRQFSSYDRATKTPNEKSWFANWDRSMFIRTDTIDGKKEYVMMDTDGPGAIVRFWMTFGGENTGKGILRIYFDNQAVPAIEGNPFDILSRGKLVGAPLSTSVSDSTEFAMRGHNLYLPLPYAKHCKIVYQSDYIKDAGAKTGGEAVYYNIDYRTYEKGTTVATYSARELEKYKDILKVTQDKLQKRTIFMSPDTKKTDLHGIVKAGESIQTTLSEHSSAVRLLTFKLKSSNLEQALRSSILELSFDGKPTVKCPIGDFFGAGYRVRFTNTYYTKVSNDTVFSCSWVMPFKKACTVKIENRGAQDLEITNGEIVTAPYNWDNNTMYFSAAWRQYTHLATGEMKSQEGDGDPFDMHYINLKGKGVYMGDGICIFNTVYAWWGEGDEKVYVDNENFPSFIGTGSEDYYGYAWCRPEKFSNHPFIAQPDGSGNFVPGYSVNIRYRGLDGIPFASAFRFDMEMWHWTRAIINFSHVNYWYIKPEDAIDSPSYLREATEPVALKREDIVSPVLTNNKIEAENLILESKTGGDFYYNNNVHKGWSGNVQLAWDDSKPSDTLTLSFISKEEKTADVIVSYSKGKRHGHYKIAFNGGEAVSVDASNPTPLLSKLKIKNVQLVRGKNILKITSLPSGGKDMSYVGIDCIEFN